MSGSFVVDASVALKWYVNEPDSDQAEWLLGKAELLHAPELLRTELGNALWKNARRRTIGRNQALAGLDSIGRTIARWHPVDTLLPQALAWSLEYDHPIYDFCYIALARSLGLTVVTADQALIRKLAGSHEAQYLSALSDLT